jgi:protein-L-isoaspartate(D-aspartate) O-methyltransferase
MMPDREIVNHTVAERQELLEQLVQKGIRDERVLEAIGTMPRHQFVESVFERRAYEDSALPIGCQQTISQPYTVARMTELLQIKRGDKVLEIGTGSGYQACILSAMGARVFTVERHAPLLELARKRFDKLRYNIATRIGDGTIGWGEFAPYNKIIVTAGAPEIPQSLLRQLSDGGRMVIPVGSEQAQSLIVIERQGEEFQEEKVLGFKFVPLIGREGWNK